MAGSSLQEYYPLLWLQPPLRHNDFQICFTELATAQLQTNHLPDERVLIYTNPLKSAPKPMWQLLDAACVFGCLGVLKSPKGSTRKFTFPSRPWPIPDYSRHAFMSSPFPPDRQSYHKHPCFSCPLSPLLCPSSLPTQVT